MKQKFYNKIRSCKNFNTFKLFVLLLSFIITSSTKNLNKNIKSNSIKTYLEKQMNYKDLYEDVIIEYKYS